MVQSTQFFDSPFFLNLKNLKIKPEEKSATCQATERWSLNPTLIYFTIPTEWLWMHRMSNPASHTSVHNLNPNHSSSSQRRPPVRLVVRSSFSSAVSARSFVRSSWTRQRSWRYAWRARGCPRRRHQGDSWNMGRARTLKWTRWVFDEFGDPGSDPWFRPLWSQSRA